jgi:C-terminal processing protease CtpA/Prc
LTSWDSLFAAHAVSIADAPSRAEYGRRVAALMDGLHDDAPVATTPQRALEYNGFPPTGMQTSGGYTLRWRKASAGETYRVEMGEGIHVDVRLSEGSRESSGTTQIGEPPGDPEWRKAYPTAGYRILGAARLWSTIHYFFPYKALIVDNWDAQLRIALPKVELAKNALAYGIAIAEFAAHIGDSHVSVGSAALSVSIGTGAIGTGPIGAAARLVESQLVITRIVDSSASRAGLRVGDVVVSVDGVSIASRIKRLMPLLAASTPQAMRSRLNATLLRGPDDSAARLVVRRADGRARTVSVPRDVIFASKFRNQRDGSIVRLLPSNIGYVDLDRLSPAMVDGAFRKLAGTKAIVFDMRGYPQGTAWAIAARLNTHGAGTTAAKFKRLIVPSPDTTRTTVYDFDQSIPSSFLWRRYSGRTVMLIDERTMSQAEHTGLFFEAANGTEFIGSPTVGANGDVTSVLLPGNIGITFTGHDVRHADGRQLQRVGLIPHLTVNPTISGIRAGRDEVLDAAFHHVGGTGVIPPDTVP